MGVSVQWEDCPRKDGGEHAWSLIQTPAKGTLEVVCISPRVVGAYVHFWNNRTLGCTGEDCEPCQKNRAKFWEGYVAAIKTRTFDRLIVRITEKIGGRIAAWRLDRHTLRGAVMEFDRPSRTPNGRIRLVIQAGHARHSLSHLENARQSPDAEAGPANCHTRPADRQESLADLPQIAG
jgi:hypothetical protein